MIDVSAIRGRRSIVVGAALKIAAVEALQGEALTGVERRVLAGSEPWWRENGTEVEELVPMLRAGITVDRHERS